MKIDYEKDKSDYIKSLSMKIVKVYLSYLKVENCMIISRSKMNVLFFK